MKSGTEVKISSISGTSDELLAQLSQKSWYLPMLEKMSEHRRREWLAVRVLLKQTLGEEKEIRYTALGKPYLADNSYFISISHTKGYVAIAVNKEHPVGVDIEYRSPRVEKIRSRFMSAEEENHLSTTNPSLHLLLHWSAKETLYKILEDIHVDFQAHLHIEPFEPNDVAGRYSRQVKGNALVSNSIGQRPMSVGIPPSPYALKGLQHKIERVRLEINLMPFQGVENGGNSLHRALPYAIANKAFSLNLTAMAEHYAERLDEWSEFSASESFTEHRQSFTIHYQVTDDYVVTCA
jgi:4'-phosphopantetheinyl transferase EntD